MEPKWEVGVLWNIIYLCLGNFCPSLFFLGPIFIEIYRYLFVYNIYPWDKTLFTSKVRFLWSPWQLIENIDIENFYRSHYSLFLAFDILPHAFRLHSDRSAKFVKFIPTHLCKWNWDLNSLQITSRKQAKLMSKTRIQD